MSIGVRSRAPVPRAFPPRAERTDFLAHLRKVLGDPAGCKQTVVWNGQVAGNIVSWSQEERRLVGYWQRRRTKRRATRTGDGGILVAMQPRTTEELVRVFAEEVNAQDQCIMQGDHRQGNRHAKKYMVAAQELLARGDEAIDRFCALLDHPLTGVRVTAAAYLLASRTEQAVATLRPIAASGVGLPSLGAQMTLQRYERGELEIK
jgi:hypothetical protein